MNFVYKGHTTLLEKKKMRFSTLSDFLTLFSKANFLMLAKIENCLSTM